MGCRKKSFFPQVHPKLPLNYHFQHLKHLFSMISPTPKEKNSCVCVHASVSCPFPLLTLRSSVNFVKVSCKILLLQQLYYASSFWWDSHALHVPPLRQQCGITLYLYCDTRRERLRIIPRNAGNNTGSAF